MSCDILYVKYCLQCKASDINVTTRKSSAAPACVLKCHPLARQILQLKVGLFKRPILGSQLRYDLQSGKNKFLQQQNRQQAKIVIGAVVVARWSLPAPDDLGSNRVKDHVYRTFNNQILLDNYVCVAHLTLTVAATISIFNFKFGFALLTEFSVSHRPTFLPSQVTSIH